MEALRTQVEEERSEEELINAYTKLADAYAALQKEVAASTPEPEAEKGQTAPTPRIPPPIAGSKSPEPQRSSSRVSNHLREDLAAANRNVHELNTQLAVLRDEIETYKRRESTHDTEASKLNQRITKLESEKLTLSRRLKDKDGELKEKARLVANVQDEMLGMEMQVNVAEERAKKLENDNAELVERWMQRMGNEADAMNRGSGWK